MTIMFKHIHKQHEYQSARMISGHRYLAPDDKSVYDSVTTILGKTKSEYAVQKLEEWRQSVGIEIADYIFHESAIIGTQAHQMNEDYLCNAFENRNTSGDFVDDSTYGKDATRLLARAHHENFKPYLDKINNIHGTEIILHSDTLRLAGTSDCIAEYEGVLSIIDYKTKRSPQKLDWVADYFLQAAAYALMYEELTDIKIEQAVILVSSELDTMQAFVADIAESRKKEFLSRLELYNYNQSNL